MELPLKPAQEIMAILENNLDICPYFPLELNRIMSIDVSTRKALPLGASRNAIANNRVSTQKPASAR
jgi:hypothetical protein